MIQCLGEPGDSILGMPATDLYAIRDSYEEMKAINQELIMTPLKVTVRCRIDLSGYSQSEDGTSAVRFSATRVDRIQSFQQAN